MKRIVQLKNKTVLLLISAISVLCIGFIILGCGTSPQLKITDPNAGAFGLDFTDCPISGACLVAFTSTSFNASSDTIQGKTLTLEAWIKPKATSTGLVVDRMGAGVRGAKIIVQGVSGDNTAPMFQIRRVVASPSGTGGTSSVSYTVTGSVIDTSVDEWTHVAGVLTDQDHSGVAGHPACADATPIGGDTHVADGTALNDPWHLDFYRNGVIDTCAVTYGGTTDASDSDPTFAADAYAHEPDAKTSQITFMGVVDEVRIWNTERTVLDCMNTELGLSGNCSRMNNNLILNVRFNEGKGHGVADFAGVFGAGGKEYSDGGLFPAWNTGWTTDIPPALNSTD